jgi:tetratricopeptide (TPR) repeat protein
MGAKMLLKGTGNAERGLGRIRLAIDKGLFASRQAAGFLLTLYVLNEKDYLKASDLAATLREDFPESSYFHFIETLLLHYQGKDVESYNSGKELFDRMRLAPAKFRKKQAGTLCGLFGDACYSKENLKRAVKWLSMAVVAAGHDQKNKEWSAYLYFMRGLAFSLLGNVKSARIDYNRASKLPDFAGTHAWARHCAQHGCAEKDVRLYLAGGSPKR